MINCRNDIHQSTQVTVYESPSTEIKLDPTDVVDSRNSVTAPSTNNKENAKPSEPKKPRKSRSLLDVSLKIITVCILIFVNLLIVI